MSNFILGTFYTKDTPYEDVFTKYFLPSAMELKKKYNVDWKVAIIENAGSWNKNVAEKPRIILEMLNTLSYQNDQRSLVFLDSDSNITKYPELFDKIEADIAFHKLDWKTWYGYENSTVKELLSGTLFLKNNEKVKSLVQSWYEDAIKTSIWEQKVLDAVLGKRNDLTIFELPIEYCYIESMPNGQKPLVQVDDPVIIHHQVSRQLRRKIGR